MTVLGIGKSVALSGFTYNMPTFYSVHQKGYLIPSYPMYRLGVSSRNLGKVFFYSRKGSIAYRVSHLVADLGWVYLDLGSSPGWWAATVANYLLLRQGRGTCQF